MPAISAPCAETDIRLGASYQLSHALAMGLAALAGRGRAVRCATISASLFLAGIVLFSGGLYLLALTGIMNSPSWCRSAARPSSPAGSHWR